MSQPKIILYDIETAFNAVALFSLHDKANANISYNNLLSERYLICASWKELGKDKVTSVSVLDDKERFAKDPHDDYVVVKAMHDMLSQADVIVAHNGDRFDLPMFNARAIYHGLRPLPTIPAVDTLKAARAKFKFNSNRLDYLAQLFGVGAKMQTTPGLWMAAFKGKAAAIREMVKYNKQDVLVLEKVYQKLRPYMDRHPNMGLLVESDKPVCPNCGKNHLIRHGYRLTQVAKYVRYVCKSCGKYSRARTAETSGKVLSDG